MTGLAVLLGMDTILVFFAEMGLSAGNFCGAELSFLVKISWSYVWPCYLSAR